MGIGIGIDTGGTYTDAVIYDFDSRQIIGASKALTTKDDLSVGIQNALDGLNIHLAKRASIVSLSTTLGTNACVENKGGRAKLIFIGVSKKVVMDVGKKYGLPPAEEIFFLDSKTALSGEIFEEPDWGTFLERVEAWIKDAEAVGIVDIHGMNNGAVLEKKAKALLSDLYSIPIICGHELFSELNSLKRGASTLLNTRLLPIINDFLSAINISLHKRGINAPVVIVRSDGSLMSEEFTALRPIETLMSGPAASTMGGLELARSKDALIIDMGGTTTDIAFVKNGIPVKDVGGISIGNWKTFVKGLSINTIGLGGDSAVRFDLNGKMTIEPVRLTPLSIAAERWPQILDKLKRLLSIRKRHTHFLHEFFYLVKNAGNGSYTNRELLLCKALQNGPLSYYEAANAVGTDVYNFDVRRLEQEGIIARCGLTPTDIMHVKGDFDKYNTQAAILGAEFVAGCLGKTVEELCGMVYDKVKKTLYINLVRLLIDNVNPELGEIDDMISKCWDNWRAGRDTEFVSFSITSHATLVGIGAPIHIFLPDVAAALSSEYVVPNYAEVANALGSLAGSIAAVSEVIVKPSYSVGGINGYVVFGSEGGTLYKDKEEAISVAREDAKNMAVAEAWRRIGNVPGNVEVTDISVDESGSILNTNAMLLLEIKVTAKAVGILSGISTSK